MNIQCLRSGDNAGWGETGDRWGSVGGGGGGQGL